MLFYCAVQRASVSKRKESDIICAIGSLFLVPNNSRVFVDRSKALSSLMKSKVNLWRMLDLIKKLEEGNKKEMHFRFYDIIAVYISSIK